MDLYAKAERRKERERELAARITALPQRRYGLILADPEWKWRPYHEVTGGSRSASNHYPVSDTAVIAARQVESIAAHDCILFLWAIGSMLPEALQVMGAWGFTYKSNLVWVKDRQGTGFWNRARHELLLIGTRGHPVAPALGTQLPSVIEAPRRAHSEKPELVAKWIERIWPNTPKIELNRRGPPRPGWDAWGNEVEP